jgi:hypothetical protein
MLLSCLISDCELAIDTFLHTVFTNLNIQNDEVNDKLKDVKNELLLLTSDRNVRFIKKVCLTYWNYNYVIKDRPTYSIPIINKMYKKSLPQSIIDGFVSEVESDVRTRNDNNKIKYKNVEISELSDNKEFQLFLEEAQKRFNEDSASENHIFDLPESDVYYNKFIFFKVIELFFQKVELKPIYTESYKLPIAWKKLDEKKLDILITLWLKEEETILKPDFNLKEIYSVSEKTKIIRNISNIRNMSYESINLIKGEQWKCLIFILKKEMLAFDLSMESIFELLNTNKEKLFGKELNLSWEYVEESLGLNNEIEAESHIHQGEDIESRQITRLQKKNKLNDYHVGNLHGANTIREIFYSEGIEYGDDSHIFDE